MPKGDVKSAYRHLMLHVMHHTTVHLEGQFHGYSVPIRQYQYRQVQTTSISLVMSVSMTTYSSSLNETTALNWQKQR
ncbi:hypothetical protein PHMEG_00010321 [Phytophthora megakarya]|uniref:Uncharacterized protein n=1 Tax=Phytophthora megakarya TaxID=4795 RepID=A0A225WEC2_9STRA|nr:hypothetical protein PHMEG_00010321 [Phytophthora megakarya]